MNIQNSLPLVIYDDKCYLCVKFAKIINFLTRGKLRLIGHYTEFGKKIRDEVLDSSALEMFWFIDEKTAYGGRAALFPLFSAILLSKGKADKICIQKFGSIGCRDTKAVFLRSASLLSNSKKIKISR